MIYWRMGMRMNDQTDLKELNALINGYGDDERARGLLDIEVELSVPDIFAGDEFTVFVLIKNPFDRPVWVQRVSVSLPDAIRLSAEQGNTIDDSAKQRSWWQLWLPPQGNEDTQYEKDRIATLTKKVRDLHEKINDLDKQILEAGENIEELNTKRHGLNRLLQDVQNELADIVDKQKRIEVYLNGKSVVANIQATASTASRTAIYLNEEAVAHNIALLSTPEYQEDPSQKVELQSSLPKFTALHPGDTVVFTVKLKPIFRLDFTPAQFRLQFNTLYTFVRRTEAVEDFIKAEDETAYHANTSSKQISVRAPVSALLIGSILGAFAGAVVRELINWQNNGFGGWVQLIASFVIAVVLGSASVIFTARKSDTQSFVSVEDFWGGCLIGFLVGYTGTSFFNEVAGLSAP